MKRPGMRFDFACEFPPAGALEHGDDAIAQLRERPRQHLAKCNAIEIDDRLLLAAEIDVVIVGGLASCWASGPPGAQMKKRVRV